MKRRKPAYSAFEYNSIDTFVQNRIVERVADKPISELFSERIWSKAGMEHDGFIVVSPSGATLAFGFMNSSLRDLARFGMLFTPSWNKIAREQIIPPSLLTTIQTGGKPEIFTKGTVGQKMQAHFLDQTGLTNRYQWDAVLTDGDLYKAGVGGQGLYISPSRDVVVAWFCTGDGNNQEETMARAIATSLK
jgi:CubicO group peptidase (beta-lactamase class C family)